MLFKKKMKEDYDFDKDLGPPLEENKTSADSEGLFKPESESNSFSNFSASGNSNSMPDSMNSLHEHGMNIQPQQQSAVQPTSSMDSKEFQIMNSKLDAIKSELDALMQHILKLENHMDEKKKKPLW